MRIPANFKQTIKDVFYDKELALYTVSTSTDNEGFVSEELVASGTFLGNVQFSRLDQVREEYGLDQKIDVTITTDKEVSNNSIVEYAGKQYRIVKAIPYDTHYLLLGSNYE